MDGIELVDVDAFVDEQLAALEQRAALENAGRLGADIEYELIEGGPLKVYLQSRRKEAADAIITLITVNPRDGVSIAEAQATVKEYVRCAQWALGRLEDAEHAQEQIEREFGRNDDQSQQYVD